MSWALDAPASGAGNMDRDRQLWRAVESEQRPLILVRIYRWAPPAVSLGFHQDRSCVDAAAAVAAGIDVVRRPTGGAAVLHWNEWTYAVAGPLGLQGVGAQVDQLYALVGDALVSALRSLGVAAERGGGGRPAGAACFAALGGHEIHVGGRKLVGSALRRGRHAFLQHGSILNGPEHARLAELLLPGERRPVDGSQLARERAALIARTTDLQQLGHSDIDGEDIGVALAGALAARWRVLPRRVPGSSELLARAGLA